MPYSSSNLDIAQAQEVQEDMKHIRNIVTLFLLLFALCTVAAAQDQFQTESPDTSDLVVTGGLIEQVAVEKTKSPTGAMLRSMAIPGWGQLYNRQYLKALVIAGGETFFIVQAIRYWDLSEDAYNAFSGQEDYYLRSLYYQDYDFYQDRRNLYLWLSGVSIFLSMVDAYVDAHLHNFDVDITPPFDESATNDTYGIYVSFRF